MRLLVPYDEGRVLSELYALGAPIDERRDTEEGVLVRARLPGREVRRFARYLVAGAEADERVARVTRVAVKRLHPDAVVPGRAYAGDAGFDLTARERVELEPGARAVVGTGIAVAIPPGHAGLVLPRSGLAAEHGLGKVNAPGLIDEGYRGEVKVILLNTDRSERFVVEPGMRIAQLVVVELPRVELARGRRAARRASAGPAASGRPAPDAPRAADQGLGTAPLERRDPPLPAREARPRALAAPGRRRPQRRDARGGAPARARRGDRASSGEHDELPVEGPIAIVESISPERSLWSKHVVHVVFAGELDGSLENVTSSDEAVRGHRLFGPDELDGVSLHPPIARFLGRWQPGDPCVYLGARWAE